MIILDSVKQKIFELLGSHTPERGGALFGPKNFPIISYFEFDDSAQTTAVTYVPSLRLIESVQDIEKDTGLAFKGIIHSHPKGVTRPSQGDAIAVENLFLNNPHLSRIDLPIVQQCSDINDKQFIYWYQAVKISEVQERPNYLRRQKSYYMDGNSISINSKEYYTVPLYEDIKTIVDGLNSEGFDFKIPNEHQQLNISNASLFGYVVTSNNENASYQEFMYFVSVDYPAVTPIILYQSGSDTKQLHIAWDSLNNHDENIKRVKFYLNKEMSQGD